MTYHRLLAGSAVALGLAFAASAALAQPSGKGGNYGPQPPAPTARGDHHRMGRCDCMMMQGDAATHDECMAMPSAPPHEPAQPSAPN